MYTTALACRMEKPPVAPPWPAGMPALGPMAGNGRSDRWLPEPPAIPSGAEQQENTVNTPDDMQLPAAEPATSRAATVPQHTKNQIRASATADGIAVKAKWKTLLTEARATWEKVPAEDLAKVDGNFHKLAGLVQLRYQLGREESDRQVRDFFDKHYAVA